MSTPIEKQTVSRQEKSGESDWRFLPPPPPYQVDQIPESVAGAGGEETLAEFFRNIAGVQNHPVVIYTRQAAA